MKATGSMQVTELARRSGTTPDTVRYYCRIGLLSPRRRVDNGYKQFTGEDLKRLRFIRKARWLGFTLNDIREILDESARGHLPCPRVREIVQLRIEQNRQRLEQALALQQRMEKALARWSRMPDQAPDGEAICRLIESFDTEGYTDPLNGEQDQ